MDIQYIAAMNPTAGSFEICERCQRHFATFAIAMPSQSDLNTIFTSLFGGHLSSFQPAMQELTGKIVETAIQVHEAVSTKFFTICSAFHVQLEYEGIDKYLPRVLSFQGGLLHQAGHAC